MNFLLYLLFLMLGNCMFKIFFSLFTYYFSFNYFLLIYFHYLFHLILNESFKPEFFKSLFNRIKFIHCIWWGMLMYINVNVALILTCFHMTNGCVTFFLSKTIVVSFLHLVVLFCKLIFNHTLKHQFVVLVCHILLFIRAFQYHMVFGSILTRMNSINLLYKSMKF